MIPIILHSCKSSGELDRINMGLFSMQKEYFMMKRQIKFSNFSWMGLLLGIIVGLGNMVVAMDNQEEKYLMVLLHDIDKDLEQTNELATKITHMYNEENSGQNLLDKVDFFCPTAPNKHWFEVPPVSAASSMIAAALKAAFWGSSMTDKFVNMNDNIKTLNQQVLHELQNRNLSNKKLIVWGVSQGGFMGLIYGLGLKDAALAVMGSGCLYIPCDVNSFPHHVKVTNGDKDKNIQKGLSQSLGMLQSRLGKAPKNAKTDLQIVNFPNDDHKISDDQLQAIVKSLSDLINNPLPHLSKAMPNPYADTTGEESTSSEDDVTVGQEPTAEEQEAFVKHLFKSWYPHLFDDDLHEGNESS